MSSSTYALLFLFGPAACGFTYLVSFGFRSPSFCNLFVIVSVMYCCARAVTNHLLIFFRCIKKVFNFFIGMAGPIICFILRLLAVDPAQPKPNLKTAAIVVEWILRIVPSFCLGRGLLFSINIAFFEIIEGKQLTAWSSTIALYDVMLLGIESFIYIAATVQFDVLSSRPKTVNSFRSIFKYLCFRRKKKDLPVDHTNSNEDVDVDVVAEIDRVSCGESENDLIVLKDLTKIYNDGKVAVDKFSLGVPPGECFGLLGVNGAGKRQCFRHRGSATKHTHNHFTLYRQNNNHVDADCRVSSIQW